MKVTAIMLKGFLVGVLSMLSLGVGMSGVHKVSDRYAYDPVLLTAAAGPGSAPHASFSVQQEKSHDEYCRPGTFLGRYYRNYYSSDADSREFFYFQRDWLSVCSN